MSFPAILRRSFPSRRFRPGRVWAVALGLVAISCGAGGGSGWERHAPLPEARTEVAAAVLGDRIVVVGGFVSSGGNSALADVYSIPENRWRRLPSLPVAVDHAAAASARGRVYVVGGYGVDRRPLRTAFVLERGRWRRLAQLPEPRAAAAAAVAGGRLYVVGGVEERGGLARVALELDLATGRWKRAPGPTAREH